MTIRNLNKVAAPCLTKWVSKLLPTSLNKFEGGGALPCHHWVFIMDQISRCTWNDFFCKMKDSFKKKRERERNNQVSMTLWILHSVYLAPSYFWHLGNLLPMSCLSRRGQQINQLKSQRLGLLPSHASGSTILKGNENWK